MTRDEVRGRCAPGGHGAGRSGRRVAARRRRRAHRHPGGGGARHCARRVRVSRARTLHDAASPGRGPRPPHA